MNARIDDLELQLSEAKAEIEAMRPELDKYGKLLYAVGKKYPGESRFETALRYIKSAEEPENNTAVCESRKQP